MKDYIAEYGSEARNLYLSPSDLYEVIYQLYDTEDHEIDFDKEIIELY